MMADTRMIDKMCGVLEGQIQVPPPKLVARDLPEIPYRTVSYEALGPISAPVAAEPKTP